MPTNTTDQGLTLPVDADAADAPTMMQSYNGGVEPRLNRRYANLATRGTNYGTSATGDQTFLQAELRQEIFNGSVHVSGFPMDHWSYVRLGAAQNLTQNSTTLQNVTNMVVALPTTGSFGFEFMIFHDSSTVADIKFAFTFPTVTSMRWGGHGLAAGAANSTGDGQFGTASASGTALAYGGAGVGTIIKTTLEGEIIMNGTNSGNLQLQAAQNTAEATAITINIGTRMRVWRFA